MAVYSKLLLYAGGGIISASQQADQVNNTATVLIGLGGTGIDCLRTIKTQVHSRLKADDLDAVVPKYEHIRFLGVDTDKMSQGDQEVFKASALMALDNTEYFSLSHPHVKRAFSNPKGLEMREELSWLRWKDIETPDLGNGPILVNRQVGRFMFMDKSASFIHKLEQVINEARKDLSNPIVNVHIFSGLCGNTGSGIFLDVCYIVRHIANTVGPINILGYFFMPDVNLSAITMAYKGVRRHIIANGYAAMQELDHCMQLQYNGGSFVQKYQNGIELEWKAPPVDMCHLVCATDASNSVIENGYDYAMNVTTEYVMDCLTYSNDRCSLDTILSIFHPKVRCADGEKVIGSHLAYCVIGASCASIPLREINTYLASELFGKFSCICQNVPNKADVENLAISVLARDAQSIADIYNSLEREMRDGFDDSYSAYDNDSPIIRDYDLEQLITSYNSQSKAKLLFVDKNASELMSSDNPKSLIHRVDTQLRNLIRNINYGPKFAFNLVSSEMSYNLINIIDGLIQENTSRWRQEAAQYLLRRDDYDSSKEAFKHFKLRHPSYNLNRRNSPFKGLWRQQYDFEYYLMLFEQHKLAMRCYEKLNEVLTVFRKQIEELTAAYYIKLNRVCDTLINTFKENRDALASEKIMQAKGSFSIPMMTIAELKPTLDAEIEQINVPGMLDAFMRLFLENEETWISEDENKIAKLVNEFFVKTAFGGFANRTITSFLKDKYGITNDAQLANKIYNEWVKMLTTKASPLFYFNNGVWCEDQTAKLAFLSIPDSSAPIQAATDQMFATNNMWCKKEGTLTDRVTAVYISACLPLCSYGNCAEFERIYYSRVGHGYHIYEGKEVPGMKFDDWCKLPPLTPQSLLNVENAPYEMRNMVITAQKLYDEAAKFGIFNDDNSICAPAENGVKALRGLIETARMKADQIYTATDLASAQELLAQLEAAKSIPMVATKHVMQNDGYAAKREVKLSVQKDHFVAASGYHAIVKDILCNMKQMGEAANNTIELLKNSIANFVPTQIL